MMLAIALRWPLSRLEAIPHEVSEAEWSEQANGVVEQYGKKVPWLLENTDTAREAIDRASRPI